MTFNDLHAVACSDCGQSDGMVSQILLNDVLEREGRKEFTQDMFDDCLERAITVYMPYYNELNVVHVKYANLYALCIANHRSEIHAEERIDEIGRYKAVVLESFDDGEKMVEMGTRSWWAS